MSLFEDVCVPGLNWLAVEICKWKEDIRHGLDIEKRIPQSEKDVLLNHFPSRRQILCCVLNSG